MDVGWTVGALEPCSTVGRFDLSTDGWDEGDELGSTVGPAVGPSELTTVGVFDPSVDGCDEGKELGPLVGTSDLASVG